MMNKNGNFIVFLFNFEDVSNYNDANSFNPRGRDVTLTKKLIGKTFSVEKGANQGANLIRAAEDFATENGVKLKSLTFSNGNEVLATHTITEQTDKQLKMTFTDHKIDLKNGSGAVVVPQVGIYTYTTPYDLANKYHFLRPDADLKAALDRELPDLIPNNEPITFKHQAIKVQGNCIIKLFYYSESAQPMGPNYHITKFGQPISYALDEEAVKAFTYEIILDNPTNIQYWFDYWIEATAHVPLASGNLVEVDKTRLMYGTGDIVSLGTLYNE